MKYLTLITLLLTIVLTSCTASKQIDINEFIENYNKISENNRIDKEDLTTTKDGETYIHKIIINNTVVISLAENQKAEITECTVSTAKSTDENLFKEISTYCISALTTISKQEAITTYESVNNNYKSTLNQFTVLSVKDKLQKSIIISAKDEIYKANNHTLKDFNITY